MKIRHVLMSAIALGSAALSAPASAAVIYDWSGSSTGGGVRMEASFSFQSDSPLGDEQILNLSTANCVFRLNGSNVGCARIIMGRSFGVNLNSISVMANPVGIVAFSINSGFTLASLDTTGSYQSINGSPSTLTVTNTAPAVPEPATWAMLIVGFGLIGGTLRQPKASTAATSHA
ncbi:PEPxxWA-CTERM sorting domain-containing protein [Sphingomonas changnyeongensis]|uniref:PEPxxWA-CTERM sorting domain-containing protein n=1 Tax=Sphingomonas changnyeongensis TaxID=2698679 RepID=A0A7Z2S910_9SPHN|nr:PEPxxWA-CTERM sorting domain-containing protein [Sphingomonas changnyeongensis]QHL91272.1 PEPxxWA-CTERM sorting domain-containing protein [Sphingomonas changnyeongensis]